MKQKALGVMATESPAATGGGWGEWRWRKVWWRTWALDCAIVKTKVLMNCDHNFLWTHFEGKEERKKEVHVGSGINVLLVTIKKGV